VGESTVQDVILCIIMVIVIALNAIASFSIPTYTLSISFLILLFGFLFAAAAFGLFGFILSYIMVNIHIVNLKSVCIIYSTPFSPFLLMYCNDIILRSPIPTLSKRPQYLETEDDESGDLKGEKQRNVLIMLMSLLVSAKL